MTDTVTKQVELISPKLVDDADAHYILPWDENSKDSAIHLPNLLLAVRLLMRYSRLLHAKALLDEVYRIYNRIVEPHQPVGHATSFNAFASHDFSSIYGRLQISEVMKYVKESKYFSYIYREAERSSIVYDATQKLADGDTFGWEVDSFQTFSNSEFSRDGAPDITIWTKPRLLRTGHISIAGKVSLSISAIEATSFLTELDLYNDWRSLEQSKSSIMESSDFGNLELLADIGEGCWCVMRSVLSRYDIPNIPIREVQTYLSGHFVDLSDGCLTTNRQSRLFQSMVSIEESEVFGALGYIVPPRSNAVARVSYVSGTLITPTGEKSCSVVMIDSTYSATELDRVKFLVDEPSKRLELYKGLSRRLTSMIRARLFGLRRCSSEMSLERKRRMETSTFYHVLSLRLVANHLRRQKRLEKSKNVSVEGFYINRTVGNTNFKKKTVSKFFEDSSRLSSRYQYVESSSEDDDEVAPISTSHMPITEERQFRQSHSKFFDNLMSELLPTTDKPAPDYDRFQQSVRTNIKAYIRGVDPEIIQRDRDSKTSRRKNKNAFAYR